MLNYSQFHKLRESTSQLEIQSNDVSVILLDLFLIIYLWKGEKDPWYPH